MQANAAAEPASGAAGATVDVVSLEVVKPRKQKRMGPGGQMFMSGGPPGTVLNIEISFPDKRIIGLDESATKIKEFSDDKGANLLKADDGQRMSFGDRPLFEEIAEDGKSVVIKARAPRVPTKGAQKILLNGLIVLRCGSTLKSFEQKNVALKQGTEINVGPEKITVGQVSDQDFGETKFMVSLAMPHSDLISKVEFLEGDAPLKVVPQGRTVMRFGNTVKSELSYGLPKKLGQANLKITYFDKVETVPVPLSVSVGVGL